MLEGRASYDRRYPLPEDAAAADAFLDARPAGVIAGDLGRSTGLRGRVVETAMPAAVESALIGAVQGQFAWMDPTAGLRFRSSSTVEDVEGFNGAGLYISATGYLSAGPGDRTVSEAIREVWGAYWGAEAFEEREAAHLEHLDGGMGVLVHPRFDDTWELSNSVLTASLLPDGSHEVIVNAQDGAVSVANPPTTCPPVLPETVRMRDATGTLVIERLSSSTEVPAGEQVLDDSQLTSLFTSSVDVVHAWLDAENSVLAPALQRSVLTLDLEAREMDAGWLGSESPRLVTKQSRSLEPSVAKLPDSIQALPAPRDVLARASSVDRVVCSDGRIEASAWTVTTDAFQPPDMGYAQIPMLVAVDLVALQPISELLWVTGDGATWSHLDVLDAQVTEAGIDAEVVDGTVVFADASAFAIDIPDGQLTGTATCFGETVWASPDAYLQGLLDD
ncbi:MAG: hypothetical protein H6736_17790 [Alphaproteobacteria bacterium]|nr:hypothetical protein [Alphaproteobacteria bacterium]